MAEAAKIAVPSEWREEFEAAARRPLQNRMRYGFIRTYKPVLDDAPFRSWNSTAELTLSFDDRSLDGGGAGRAARLFRLISSAR